MPEKTQKEIIEYFKAFDEINDVFKGCDTKKIEEYMKKNNVPHPFADKKPDEQTNVLQNGNKVKSDSIQKKDLKTKQKTVHYASAKKKSVTTNKKTARHTSAQKNNLALLKTRQKNRH